MKQSINRISSISLLGFIAQGGDPTGTGAGLLQFIVCDVNIC